MKQIKIILSFLISRFFLAFPSRLTKLNISKFERKIQNQTFIYFLLAY